MRKLGIKLGLLITMMAGGVGLSSSAYARPDLGRIFGSTFQGYQSAKVIEDGIEHLIDAKFALRSGNRYQAKSNMRKAFYKLKMASMMLGDNYMYEEIQGELQVAQMKLNDRYLNPREKLKYGLACASFSFVKLVSTMPVKIVGAKQTLKLGIKLSQAGALNAVKVLLLNSGEVFSAPLTYKAQEPVNVAISKLEDPYLSRHEKRAFAIDCLQIALNKIR